MVQKIRGKNGIYNLNQCVTVAVQMTLRTLTGRRLFALFRGLIWGVGAETPLERAQRAVWGMFYADDAGVVSRSQEGLARMMTTIVEVFGEFGLTVSEKKTETLLMRAPEKQPKKGGSPPPPLVIEAAGQKYAQTTQFRYLGGLVNEDGELTQEINHRSRAAWACIRRFSRELFDRPRAPWRLKVRLLRAEAMEALLYGCMTWAPRREHYRLLRRTHHRLLLRVIGYRLPIYIRAWQNADDTTMPKKSFY